MYNFRLNKLRESGQLDKYWLQWKPQARTDCFASQNIDPIKIQIVVSLFIMLSAFVIISVGIYIVEVLLKKKFVISANKSESVVEAIESQNSITNTTPMNNYVQNEDSRSRTVVENT